LKTILNFLFRSTTCGIGEGFLLAVRTNRMETLGWRPFSWLPSRAIRFASALHIQGPPIVNPSIFHPRADLSGRSMHCLWPPDLSEYLSFWSLVTVYT
jgi:hypothetical protein